MRGWARFPVASVALVTAFSGIRDASAVPAPITSPLPFGGPPGAVLPPNGGGKTHWAFRRQRCLPRVLDPPDIFHLAVANTPISATMDF